jgi:hypothetical protein
MITIHTGNNVELLYDHLLQHGQVDENRQMYYKSNECIQEYIKSRTCFWMPEAYMTLAQQRYFVNELINYADADINVYTNSDIIAIQFNNNILKNISLSKHIRVFAYYDDGNVELLEWGNYGYMFPDMNEVLRELAIEAREACDLVDEI